jgi:hypothetical protein
MFAGRKDEALARIDEAWRKFSKTEVVWLCRWYLLALAGRPAEAERFRRTIARETGVHESPPHATLDRLSDLRSIPPDAQAGAFQAMLRAEPSTSLSIELCCTAAECGHADLAFETLFAALDSGRPLAESMIDSGRGVARALVAYAFFKTGAASLRHDRRFAMLCARLDLVDYWRESGQWPDCADEVSYGFRAECERAVRSRDSRR